MGKIKKKIVKDVADDSRAKTIAAEFGAEVIGYDDDSVSLRKTGRAVCINTKAGIKVAIESLRKAGF